MAVASYTERRKSALDAASLQSSMSSLPSNMGSTDFDEPQQHHQQSILNSYQDVPIELKSVTSEAVSKQISRIHSRRSDGAPVEDLEKLHPTNSINDAKYSRFPNKTKVLCVFLAGMAGFLSPLSSLSILPALPEIAARFNTTEEMISISNAIFCVFMSFSPCIFSPCSDIYGRKPTFLLCGTLYSIASVLVSISQNLAMFFIFRCMTALFATAFFSIGGHMVADVYHPTQRGNAMGIIVCGAQIGTGFGPVIGGIIVNYTSWRVILAVMAGLGCIVSISALVFLPETSVQTKLQYILEEERKVNSDSTTKFKFIPFNPFRIMGALKYPTLLLDGMVAIATLYSMFLLQTPIRYVLEPRFHLTKPLYSGLFYLAPGLGYLIGSFIGGKWADWTVKKYIKVKGRRVPEDRLRTIIIPLGVAYPVTTMIYGWCVQYEKGGMAVPIIALFLGGIAQTCIFPASNAYCVDSMPEIGGDAIASSYFTRYVASAVASASCLKSINTIGLGWSCTITAFVLWTAFVCTVILIIWGEEIRIKSLVKYGLREKEPDEEAGAESNGSSKET